RSRSAWVRSARGTGLKERRPESVRKDASIQDLTPLPEALERPRRAAGAVLLVGQVQHQGSDRDALVAQHDVAVAAGDVLVLVLVAADPVVRAAARVLLLVDVG